MKTATLREKLREADQKLDSHFDSKLQTWKNAAEALRGDLEDFGREVSLHATLWRALLNENLDRSQPKNTLVSYMATKNTEEMKERLVQLRCGILEEQHQIEKIGTIWNLVIQEETHVKSLLEASLFLVTLCAHAPDKQVH